MLSQMVARYEDDIICDFAQFYHIYDYMQFGLKKAAILACGLPKESRIMAKLEGRNYTLEEYYMVAIIDEIRSFSYNYVTAHSKTKPQKPKMIMDALLNKETGKDKAESNVTSYDTAEDYEAAVRRIKGE